MTIGRERERLARSGRGTRSLPRTWTGGSRGENQSQYKKPPCLDDTGTYCEVREGIVAQPKRVDEMAKE